MATTRLDNMEIVRRAIAAEDTYDIEQVAQFEAPSMVIHALFDSYNFVKEQQSGYNFESTQDDYEELAAREREEFPQAHTTIDEMFEVGDDKVVTITTNTSTHRSGKQVTVKSISLVRIADGKIVEGWYSWDRLGYWQQLGLVPHVRELIARLATQPAEEASSS
jgi:ketosteroid isomerase-like protein